MNPDFFIEWSVTSAAIAPHFFAARPVGSVKLSSEWILFCMAMHAEYRLETRWNVGGSLSDVVEVFRAIEDFPRWWRPVFLSAVVLKCGAANGTGRIVRLTTRGFLPYILRWQIRIVDSREPFEFSFTASGDLVGNGRWILHQEGGHVRILLRWNVTIRKRFLRSFSYALKPLLILNHRWAMAVGERRLQSEIQRRQKLSRPEFQRLSD